MIRFEKGINLEIRRNCVRCCMGKVMGKRLDESKIKEIINLHKQGFDARAIARMTGVDQTRTRLIGICKLYPEFLRDHNLPEPTEFERWRSKNLWFTDLHGLLSDFLANKDFSPRVHRMARKNGQRLWRCDKTTKQTICS